MKKLRIGSYVVAGLMLVGTSSYGDVLELKNGTILNGRYLGGTAGTIRFETSGETSVVETSQAVALTFTTPGTAAGKPAASAAGTAPPADGAAPQAPGSVPPQSKAVTIPAGTTLLVRMTDGVSSKNKPGTRFATTLDADIVVDGVTALKAGVKIYGAVSKAKQAGRLVGKSTLDIRLTEIKTDDGVKPIATSNFEEAGKRSGVKTVGGAAVGAGIGAIAGDDTVRKGAAIGAGLSVLKKGDTVTVPPGALLEFQLTGPLTLNAP